MGEVVSLAEHREAQEPHGAGQILCTACKHEWTGAAPIGTVFHTCPECGSKKAAWKLPFAAAVGDIFYSCNTCGSEHFYFTMSGSTPRVRCSGCGYDQEGIWA